ncbi:putative GAF domain-containing protein [Seiridium unicorne]|uniref:GAF domain-containing protein n=1 Tax=Seiridium unicorne TaxID=138068 RepID=A0ABR2VHY4_9PEZI
MDGVLLGFHSEIHYPIDPNSWRTDPPKLYFYSPPPKALWPLQPRDLPYTQGTAHWHQWLHSSMVHADASNFAEGATKEQAYEQVLAQAEGLFHDQTNWVSLANNTPSSDVNWADPKPTSKPQLILGPFQGKVACQTIAFGRGVCGAAAASQETQLVPDVEAFPGHIACDGDSKSEIVVPIVVRQGESSKLVAIIDIDCADLNGFDQVDQKYLERLAGLIGKGCDW